MSTRVTPDQFFFTIGGLFGTSYQVKWQDGALWHTKRPAGGEVASEAVDPSDEQWGRFWKQLESLGAWRWQQEYVDMSVRDGVFWSLELLIDGQSLISSGQNAYPPKGRGPSMTRDFRRFLMALSQLLNDRPLY